MTVTVKNKTPLVVPPSVRRQAGLKSGQEIEFKVSGRVISIHPKLSPDEAPDEGEIRDPKIREAIRGSYQEFLAGNTRPIDEFCCACMEACQPPSPSMTPPFAVDSTCHYQRLSMNLQKEPPRF